MILNNLGERIAAAKERVSIADAWSRLGLPDPPPEGSRLVHSPVKEERTPSFSIFQNGRRWKDHAGDGGGDVLDFVELITKEDMPSVIQRVLGWAGDDAPLSGHGATSLSPPPQVTASPGRTRISSDERARDLRRFERSRWPVFTDPTQADIEQIARVRKLDPCAVQAIASAGLLKVAKHNWERVFVMTEGAFAQARRLDGEPFDGGYKAMNLKGSEGAFLGASLLGTDPQPVLLIEGVVGLLEAAALIGSAGAGWSWTTLAAVSSSSRFSSQPDMLAALAGRRVRIVPDQDESGVRAATAWCQELYTAGASVSVCHLPDGFHDLGIIAKNPADHADLINQLFAI